MSNDNTTQVVETANETVEQAVPAVKTKKELKKERKEIKKHKKAVKKEAKMHSAKMTKFYRFLTAALSILVIVAMLVCTFSAIKVTSNLSKGASVDAGDSADAGDAGNAGNASNTGNASTPSNNSGSSDSSSASGDAGNAGSADSGDAGASGGAVAGDLSTKEGAVEYYKTAHAKVLAEAKSVTRTLDNNTNYKEYLEVGGNSTLAGVAKTLMGMFLAANTEPAPFSGADIAANFPPSGNSCAGLTADMIGDYSVKEEGDNYIITLTINSSEESPDLGEKSANLVSVVEASQVEDAAAGFVSFEGLRNEYIAPTVTATINKTTGQMTALHTLTPSYMKFDKATVAFVVNVNNVGIGLQYEQEWTIEW